jgi:hypothetical protein
MQWTVRAMRYLRFWPLLNAPSTTCQAKRGALLLGASVVCTILSACPGPRAQAAPPAARASGATVEDAGAASNDAGRAQRDDDWIEKDLDQNGYCLAGETEICGCPGGASGVRRCNAEGTAFGPCDACESVVTCGTQRCEVVRVEPLALSVAPCCPTGRPDRCGVDVSHFVKLHGYTASCLELDAPGTRDPSCPSQSVPMPGRGEVTLSGCRTPAGVCGFDVDIPGVIDLGCTPKPARAAGG